MVRPYPRTGMAAPRHRSVQLAARRAGRELRGVDVHVVRAGLLDDRPDHRLLRARAALGLLGRRPEEGDDDRAGGRLAALVDVAHHHGADVLELDAEADAAL